MSFPYNSSVHAPSARQTVKRLNTNSAYGNAPPPSYPHAPQFHTSWAPVTTNNALCSQIPTGQFHTPLQQPNLSPEPQDARHQAQYRLSTRFGYGAAADAHSQAVPYYDGLNTAMEGINYAPAGSSNGVPQLNPQANAFQPDSISSAADAAAPRSSRYGPTTSHRDTLVGGPSTARRNSDSQLDPQANDFQPSPRVPHPSYLANPLLSGPGLAIYPGTFVTVPGMTEANNAYSATTYQQPANAPLMQVTYPQPFPIYAAPIQQPSPVPFYISGPPSASQYPTIPPVPTLAPTDSYHAPSEYTHPLPMTSGVSSVAESHQRMFNPSAIDGNIPAQKFLSEMFTEPTQQATGPRAHRERAEAMSLWGNDWQVNQGQSDVSTSVMHVGKHLPLNSKSIARVQPDFPPLQIVEQDGITQPTTSGRGRSRKGPSDHEAYKKTRAAKACMLCHIKRGSKPYGTCAVDTGKPCPPCVSLFGGDADRYCIRIGHQNLRKFLPFNKDVVQSILPRAPNLSQLERVLDEDLTVYCKSNTSSNLRSLPVDPILAFKFDGSSNLSEKPSHDNLDVFVKDNFIVKLHLDQKLLKQLDPQEIKPLRSLEVCARYLLAISGHAQTEYRTELHPINITLAQQISYRILQQYWTRYADIFESLFELSIEWMKARKKDGMRRDVAAWLMCGLYELVEFQTAIFVPNSLSGLSSKLTTPATECLEDVKKLAACAMHVMNHKPSIPLESFAENILPIRNLAAPGVTIAHAFMPRVNSNNTQPPTAIVGLRGNTNPFDKPNPIKIADLHSSSGDMGMENLQRLLTPRPAPQVTNTQVAANRPSPVTPPAAQPGEPGPGTWSIDTQLDEVDCRFDPSELLSNQPYNTLPSHDNDLAVSFTPFHTPPLPNTPEIYHNGTYNTAQPQSTALVYSVAQGSHFANYSFEDECVTSDDGEDEGLRRASVTSRTRSSWGTITNATGATRTSFC
ncbi:MAG: hypothetical protein M1839_002550 [Geoglossum umbratile]|nr:MAG: hypothetical protein M1839_002550 [Geoglossum umbratile]